MIIKIIRSSKITKTAIRSAIMNINRIAIRIMVRVL